MTIFGIFDPNEDIRFYLDYQLDIIDIPEEPVIPIDKDPSDDDDHEMTKLILIVIIVVSSVVGITLVFISVICIIR